MVLTLYGSAMATSRVLLVILEKDLPYKFVRVDISKGEQKSEEHKSRQPFGQCPALEDDGVWMFESRAICKYLENKYPTEKKLIPDRGDWLAYGRFEQACGVEQSYFASACETIGTELFIRPSKGLGDPDQGRVAAAEEQFDTVLSYYDSILSKQKYLAGDEVTLADLFHLPNGAAMMAGPWKAAFEKYPTVLKWFQGLRERSAWQKAAAEAGAMP